MTDNVAIIGAGLSGLCMAIQLKRAGTESFTVFEKADDVGGVWRDNVYPGAECDLASHLYSYSFEQHDGWTHTYGSQPEILNYLRRCAQKYGVAAHLRLGTEITHASFDSDAGVWRLRTAVGEEHSARTLVTATGQLGRPRLPNIAGTGDFAGRAFHSSQWDPSHDLTGRTVAVVGNGCSAVQLVPQIAGQVRQLHVFQRSAKWIIPKWNREFGPVARWLFDRCSWPQTLSRGVWFLLAETIAYSPIRRGVFGRVLATLGRYHLRRQVADRGLRAKLTPRSPFGCNRMILSNDYYPTLTRNNVDLVTDGITRIVPNGIETSDGRVHEADTIIYATGFESTSFLAPIEVSGPHGLLSDAWRDGASAHLGIAVPGFPNLFMLYGPNTSSGNNSVIYMIESQVRYVIQCLEMAREEGPIEVSPDAFAEYQRDIESRLRTTVWAAGCSSWYKTESGRITNTWPLRAYRYRRATRRPDRAHFVVANQSRSLS